MAAPRRLFPSTVIDTPVSLNSIAASISFSSLTTSQVDKPCLHSIWVITVIRAYAHNVFPPFLQINEVSSGCCIICEPDLLYRVVFEAMDQWSDCNSIHRHRQRVSLGNTFLGHDGFAINEELNILAIGVNEYFEQRGTKYGMTIVENGWNLWVWLAGGGCS